MSANFPVPLKTVDRVEITTLIDNYVDLLLPSTDVIKRPPLSREGKVAADTLLAEHGLALLITAYLGEKKHTILLDTGYTKVGVLHNMEKLGINLEDIETVVISHGHMDHTSGLGRNGECLFSRHGCGQYPHRNPRVACAPDGYPE